MNVIICLVAFKGNEVNRLAFLVIDHFINSDALRKIVK